MSTYQRILVPVDGSASALLGVCEAIRLAHDQAAQIRFVFVVDESAVGLTLEGFVAFGDIIDALKRSGREALEGARRLARDAGLESETALVEEYSGRVADAIVEEALRLVGRSDRDGHARSAGPAPCADRQRGRRRDAQGAGPAAAGAGQGLSSGPSRHGAEGGGAHAGYRRTTDAHWTPARAR